MADPRLPAMPGRCGPGRDRRAGDARIRVYLMSKLPLVAVLRFPMLALCRRPSEAELMTFRCDVVLHWANARCDASVVARFEFTELAQG